MRSWRREGTGREWCTRVTVSACYRLDAAQLGAAVREHAQQLAAAGHTASAAQLARSLAFDWHAAAQSLTVRPRDTPKHLKAETRLSVTTSSAGPKGQGVRFWLICPRCSRRCGVLYASRWGRHGERLGEPLTGCRECLGLTDEARQRHKCPDWAGHVLAGPGDRRKPYKARAWGAARERALYVFGAGCARSLPGYFQKPSRPERWGLGPCPWGKAAGGRRAYKRGSAGGRDLGEPQPVPLPSVEHLGAV